MIKNNFIEKVPLQNDEKRTLINAWSLFKSVCDDLELEEKKSSKTYQQSENAWKSIANFLDSQKIEYEEVDTGTTLENGITTCCGYNFGLDKFGETKLKFCPICGAEIIAWKKNNHKKILEDTNSLYETINKMAYSNSIKEIALMYYAANQQLGTIYIENIERIDQLTKIVDLEL